MKFQSFGHLMGRADSLEKTLMLGGIGGKRRRGTGDSLSSLSYLVRNPNQALHHHLAQLPLNYSTQNIKVNFWGLSARLMSRAAVSPAAPASGAREESESHAVQTATLAGDGVRLPG